MRVGQGEQAPSLHSHSLLGFRAHLISVPKTLPAMAFRNPRSLHRLCSFTQHRHPHSSLFTRIFSSQLTQNPPPSISEEFVLNQLSDLLPINPKPPNPLLLPPQPPPVPATNSIRDRFLSPDEKLRGVFLLNLRGKSAVDAALTATGVDLTAEIFGDVVNKGNLNGESIISFFGWAIEQKNVEKCLETYNVILKTLGRRKFFNFMEEILVRMKAEKLYPSLETLEIVIDSYVRARRVSKAVELFKGLEEELGLSCNLDSFTVLLRCLCCRSHVRIANSLFNSMRGKFTFDNTAYNEIIGGWAKFGRVDKVESYWGMMVADGLSPDSITFTHRVEALGRAGRISDALDLFERMEEMGCLVNAATFNAMISNYIYSGDIEEAIKLYNGMSERNCSPDIETYDKLISALLKVRRVADALELFDEMLSRELFPTTGMITSYLERLCSFGPPHAAMLIYKKSMKAGCRLSLKAYKLLLMRLSRFGKSGMVLKIWEEMLDSGYSSDEEVYEYIVNGLCNIGQVDNAVLVVEEALRKGFCLGKIVYSKLNSKLMEMNRVQTAYKLFLKVKGVRNDINSQRFWRDNGWHF